MFYIYGCRQFKGSRLSICTHFSCPALVYNSTLPITNLTKDDKVTLHVVPKSQ